jgi:hypothetical protein
MIVPAIASAPPTFTNETAPERDMVSAMSGMIRDGLFEGYFAAAVVGGPAW